MDTPYVKLRKLREHIVLLPGLKTYKDFDIAIEVGHYELLGQPLNQKQLLLLNIASPATVRRHLSRLIRAGLVDKLSVKDDHRCAYFILTERAHCIFDQCIEQLSSLLMNAAKNDIARYLKSVNVVMNSPVKIPHFSYIAASPSHPNNECVLVNGVVIHRIDDLNMFYRALGYTDDMQKAGMEPELYRWTEFTKDKAVESEACLQNKIIEYLNNHSPTFREKYGKEYESWAASCAPENLRDSDDCTVCRMHPNNKAADSVDAA